MIEKNNEYIHVQSFIPSHFKFCGVLELPFLSFKNIPWLTFINHTPADNKKRFNRQLCEKEYNRVKITLSW